MATYNLEINVSYTALPGVSDTKQFTIDVIGYCEPNSVTVLGTPNDVDYYIGTSPITSDDLRTFFD